MHSPLRPLHLALRALESAADLAACVELQEATWGHGFADRVPASLLLITQKVGGIAAGAFEPDGSLAGFVLGFTGIRHGRPAHWSHMLAVRPDVRDRGIGRALKQYQREQLVAAGVVVMYWTFDPLVARNAHLNLTELGALVEEYVPDLYGPGDDSPVDRGIGTDRFIVRWELAAEGGKGRRRAAEASVRVEIPADIHDIKTLDPAAALEWRRRTRHAFLGHLAKGFRVSGFERAADGRGGAYLLAPPA